MLVKLIPKTHIAEDIIEKHGEIFEVKDVVVHILSPNGDFFEPSFRVSSLKPTSYFPFVGWRPWWFWLDCQNDEHYNFEILREV